MFKDNLKNLILQENLGIPEFSRIVNVQYKTVNAWLNYGKEPNKYSTLIQIVQKYKQSKGKRINLDWLITGEGEMFITAQEKESLVLSQLKEAGIELDSNGILRKKS